MMEQAGNVFQEKVDRLQERISILEEQVRRADAERTLLAQLVCRVEVLENKLATTASDEEESRRQQKQESEPGAGFPVEQKQESEPGVGNREEMSGRMANPVLSQGEEEPHVPPQEQVEREEQDTLPEGDGKDRTGDTEETHGKRTAPPSPQGCQVPPMRPPEGVAREVVVAGDGNVGRFAKELVRRLGDDGSVEYLYRRGASGDQVHEFIRQYEVQARKVPRLFVLHLGLKEVLKGEMDGLGAKLEEAWADKGSSLIVCSIPEITGRGRRSQADVVLANERLTAVCKKLGAQFLDLAKVLRPGSFAAADGLYTGDGGRQVAEAIAEAVTPFLGRSGRTEMPRGSKQGGARTKPSLETLWEAVELLVRSHRKGRSQRQRGRSGIHVADATGEAGGIGAV